MTSRVTLANVAIAVACVALGALWIFRILPSVWRVTGPMAGLFQYESRSKERTWGSVLWHAYVRAIPFGTTLFFFLVGFLLVDYLAPASFRESRGFDWLFIATFFGWLLGSLAVVLFNRPKAVVAPGLRDKPGLIRELASRLSHSG